MRSKNSYHVFFLVVSYLVLSRSAHRNATTNAPWPPMECPQTEALDVSTAGKLAPTTDGSSSVTYSYMRYYTAWVGAMVSGRGVGSAGGWRHKTTITVYVAGTQPRHLHGTRVCKTAPDRFCDRMSNPQVSQYRQFKRTEGLRPELVRKLWATIASTVYVR